MVAREYYLYRSSLDVQSFTGTDSRMSHAPESHELVHSCSHRSQRQSGVTCICCTLKTHLCGSKARCAAAEACSRCKKQPLRLLGPGLILMCGGQHTTRGRADLPAWRMLHQPYTAFVVIAEHATACEHGIFMCGHVRLLSYTAAFCAKLRLNLVAL